MKRKLWVGLVIAGVFALVLFNTKGPSYMDVIELGSCLPLIF